MTLQLYAHPFSSYSWKVEIALYDAGIPFELKMLAPEAPENVEEFHRLWPIAKMPLLIDDGRPVAESSIVIEHLALKHGAAALLPRDETALDIRFMDRFFDNYVMTPMQRYVADYLRPAEKRDPETLTEARALLDKAYRWLNERMDGREWASGEAFSMADCAAAPSLFYADWVHPIPEALTDARAYRARLLARPSVVRVVDEARPFRHFFPPGAPDRD